MAERKMSRKWLEALGLDADKIDVICEAHSDIVQSVKEERDTAQASADKLKAELDKIDRSKDWKKLYEDLEATNRKRDERTAKEAAMREVLKEAGVAEKYIGSLLRIAEYDKIRVGEDGKAVNHKELVETAKRENADFIPIVTVESGQKTPHPPVGTPAAMSKSEILAIKDTSARQKAIADNINLFQKGG